MKTARYIRTEAGMNIWIITSIDGSFYTKWTSHHSKEDIEDYYNS